MDDDEINSLVDFLAENPTAGDVIVGTGKGKSGGYRTITFYSGESLPVFLITVFAKGERADLSKGERNRLQELTKAIATEYRSKVAMMAKKGA